MRDTLPSPLADLEHALRLRPRLVAARKQQMGVLLLSGDRPALAQVIRQADESCPSCFVHRVSVLHTLKPRWGGSYAAMDQYARAVPVQDNPRLRFLAGMADLDRAEMGRIEKRYDDALVDVERACELGEYWAFVLMRGEVQRAREHFDLAQIDLDRALVLRPGDPGVLVARAKLHQRKKEYELAGLDLLASLRVDPGDSEAEGLFPQVVQNLIYQGWKFHEAGRRDDALRLFDLASELAPLDGEVLGRREKVLSAGQLTETELTALRAKVDAAPDDPGLHRQLDYALAKENRFDEVVTLWTRYLARNPDDGRAYMERAGAYHHLRLMPQTRADLKQACELGVTEGCARLR